VHGGYLCRARCDAKALVLRMLRQPNEGLGCVDSSARRGLAQNAAYLAPHLWRLAQRLEKGTLTGPRAPKFHDIIPLGMP
jgi:hypothetical protein